MISVAEPSATSVFEEPPSRVICWDSIVNLAFFHQKKVWVFLWSGLVEALFYFLIRKKIVGIVKSV